jgi:CBS domain-containing protein
MIRGLDRLVLEAESAQELMTPNPMSIHQEAAVTEAVALLTDKDISAVPVLDHAGRPVGVLSRTDIVRFLGNKGGGSTSKESAEEPAPATSSRPFSGKAADRTPVRQIMTPAVISVTPTAPAIEVVAKMLGLGNVHRLFVVDDSGALVGVISARDVLRKLRRLEFS